MAAPRYIAKKVGDKYVTSRVEDSSTCAAWTAGGALVASIGLLKGGLLGWGAVLTGAGLMYRGMTGRNPLEPLFFSGDNHGADESHGPSYARDFDRHASQRPQDEVDEASMESFPASDAPAHTSSTGAE